MKLKLLLIFIFISSNSHLQAQIVAWNLGNPNTAGDEVSINATTVHPNIEMSSLKRGAGINNAAASNTYNATNFTTAATETEAVIYNDYFECAITVKPTFQLSLTKINARLRRSSTGPNNYIWKYSLDGTTFHSIGNAIQYYSHKRTN